MPTILHIAHQPDWDDATRQGAYRPASLAREGFIHCSLPEQVIAVANAFYHGQSDLVLLFIETDRLRSTLRYEPPAEDPLSDERFPHVYGPINLDAVTRVAPLPPGSDGTFTLT